MAEIYLRELVQFSGEGGEIFSQWIKKLEDMMDLNPTPFSSEMKANHLKYCLEGFARVFFDNLAQDVRKNFNAAKLALKAKFEGEIQKSWAEGKLAKLGQKGTVCELALEVEKLVELAASGETKDAKKRRLLAEFLRKLSPEIRYEVKMKEPRTFESALEIAMKIENLMTERGEGQANKIENKVDELREMMQQMCGPSQAMYATEFNEHWDSELNEIENNWDRNDQYFQRNSPECHYCGKFGHFQRDCWHWNAEVLGYEEAKGNNSPPPPIECPYRPDGQQ
jgi:hypothetical protein